MELGDHEKSWGLLPSNLHTTKCTDSISLAIFLTSCLSIKSMDLHTARGTGYEGKIFATGTFFIPFSIWFLTCLQISKMRPVSPLQQPFWSKSPLVCVLWSLWRHWHLKTAMCREKEGSYLQSQLSHRMTPRFPGCTRTMAQPEHAGLCICSLNGLWHSAISAMSKV